ncbi:peptide-methionine (S)-S-oxide reductase [Flagellimonas sp.]|uniref:peptide-methionine (S)-S-oxide reductase n=1 Tax=Flagellimonas sp. TaxID=2058762 RepID=UPI003B502986
MNTSKIALGGGCHWCTEAVFLSLRGVQKVEQGFVSIKEDKNNFSEAVVVAYDRTIISMMDLISVHLHTHKSTSEHSFRNKYRSAVYVYLEEDFKQATSILNQLQSDFEQKLVIKVYGFGKFKPSEEQFHNYYYANPEKPFCETYISPKLKTILSKFGKLADSKKINAAHVMT